MITPIYFQPIFKSCVWGGNHIMPSATKRGDKKLLPIGEVWYISDRPHTQSVVNSKPYHGLKLQQLWQNHRAEIFGEKYINSYTKESSFPLLIKILSTDKPLSVQVHPRSGEAEKNEFWYILEASNNAVLYTGLKHNHTKQQLADAIADNTLVNKMQQLQPKKGDSIYIPSGKIHALGAGLLIAEIQQSSETTYRMYDWERTGLNGKPRDLHITQAITHAELSASTEKLENKASGTLTNNSFFRVQKQQLQDGEMLSLADPSAAAIIIIISGSLRDAVNQYYHSYDHFIVPKNCTPLIAQGKVELLEIVF